MDRWTGAPVYRWTGAPVEGDMGKGVQGGLDTLADQRAAEQLKCGRRVGHRGGRMDEWPGLWTGATGQGGGLGGAGVVTS